MNRSELLKHGKKQSVEVELPGIGNLWFRQPTAGEWEPIASEHARIFKETDGAGIPPATLMAETIATVLADQDGTKMFDEKSQKEILDMAPETMREIYEASLNYGFALGDNEEKK